jgi:hypothetical protein
MVSKELDAKRVLGAKDLCLATLDENIQGLEQYLVVHAM